MKSDVTEIAPDIYRLSAFRPGDGIQYNQFLIKDDEPFLMHTGLKTMFQTTLAGVASIIDPETLRWIAVSHFESDECGALNEWLELAGEAQALCSYVGAVINLNDFSQRAPRALMDGELLQTGRHRIHFLATPQLPHGWDSGLFFDETSKTLFCSDLFLQPGNPEPVIESGLIERVRLAVQGNLTGPMAMDMPYTPQTDAMLRRLAALGPETLAVMHGSSFRGDGQQAILDLVEVLEEYLGWSGEGS